MVNTVNLCPFFHYLVPLWSFYHKGIKLQTGLKLDKNLVRAGLNLHYDDSKLGLNVGLNWVSTGLMPN